ncbi:MAG: hypothetical protein ABL888_22880, partial [Pirellulaceae bacterium]
METPQPAKAVIGAKIAMIVFFVVLIWLPTLDALFHWDQTPHVNENRQPAAFPQLNSGLAGIRNFISGLERYYNDHFGFRKRLIYWGQTWKREWFHETLQSGVVIGQKGWLYHAESFGLTEESRRATTPFTSKELEDWQTLFDSRRDWLNRRGIHYLVVIPSDKPSIYPEYLPGWVPKQNPVTKIDQLIAHMQNHSTVEVLDVRPVLLQAKQTRQVFYLTDSHWNQYGAFITCNELIRTLSRQMPDLSPLSLNLFDLAITNGPGGNLAWVLTGAYSM